jgi:hypothetical protein
MRKFSIICACPEKSSMTDGRIVFSKAISAAARFSLALFKLSWT